MISCAVFILTLIPWEDIFDWLPPQLLNPNFEVFFNLYQLRKCVLFAAWRDHHFSPLRVHWWDVSLSLHPLSFTCFNIFWVTGWVAPCVLRLKARMLSKSKWPWPLFHWLKHNMSDGAASRPVLIKGRYAQLRQNKSQFIINTSVKHTKGDRWQEIATCSYTRHVPSALGCFIVPWLSSMACSLTPSISFYREVLLTP